VLQALHFALDANQVGERAQSLFEDGCFFLEIRNLIERPNLKPSPLLIDPSSASILEDSILSNVVLPDPFVPMSPIFSEGFI
jgi:hypothetical protein